MPSLEMLADAADVAVVLPEDRVLTEKVVKYVRSCCCTPFFGPVVYAAAVLADPNYQLHHIDVMVSGARLRRWLLGESFLHRDVQYLFTPARVEQVSPDKSGAGVLSEGQVFRGARKDMVLWYRYEIIQLPTRVELCILGGE